MRPQLGYGCPCVGYSKTGVWERHSSGSKERQAPRKGTQSAPGALAGLPRRGVPSAGCRWDDQAGQVGGVGEEGPKLVHLKADRLRGVDSAAIGTASRAASLPQFPHP